MPRARPVIVPETIVCDHGKAYLSAAFRSLGISLAPAHPDTPTDKPRAAYCTSSGWFAWN
jgi:putative transposase